MDTHEQAEEIANELLLQELIKQEDISQVINIIEGVLELC